MLSSGQKKELKSLAHPLKPIFQVGKGGVSENMLIGIKSALKAQELIKVKLLESCDEDIKVVALKISEYTKCEVVQIIGRTIVLYMRVKDGNIRV